MKKLKSNRGITLIALIITIIVMLILVATTVSVVINSGLLDTTKRAGNDYRTAWEAEQRVGEEAQFTIGGVTYNSIEEYRRSIQQENCNHEWGEYTVTKAATYTEKGERKRECTICGLTQTEEIGMLVCDEHTLGTWTVTTPATCITQGEKQATCSTCGAVVREPIPIDTENGHNYENGVCTRCGQTQLVIGAKVNGYNPAVAANGSTISTSYTSAGAQSGGSNADGTSGNGYVKQTFTVSSITEWRVLGEDEETGQIIITTADPIQTNAAKPAVVYFKGMAGYASFVDELDKISSIYGQGRYADTTKFTNVDLGNSVTINSGARSIDDYDLERIGYTVTRAGLTGTNTKTYTTDANSYTIKDNKTSSTWKFNYWDEHTSSGTKTWKTLSANESVTLGNYVYNIARPSGQTVTDKAHNMIIKKSDGTTNANYWLGSRSLGFGSGSVTFYARGVSDGYVSSANYFYISNGNPYVASRGVRPVVYLQSDINLTYDSTTQTYTIETGT